MINRLFRRIFFPFWIFGLTFITLWKIRRGHEKLLTLSRALGKSAAKKQEEIMLEAISKKGLQGAGAGAKLKEELIRKAVGEIIDEKKHNT